MLLALLMCCFQDPDPLAGLSASPGLPDVLVSSDGTAVGDADAWRTRRRPELQAAFERWVYGAAPPAPALRARTLRRGLALEGRATFDELELTFEGLPPSAPSMHLLLVLPAAAEGPVPVFLGLNKCGNHTVLPQARVRERAWIHAHCTRDGNGEADAGAEIWCLDLLVARGFGLATFACGDVDPDHDERGDGIQPYYPEHDWGTLRAWAWGLSRAVDQLTGDARVDPRRISLIGHSRRGKAALVAAAFDERVALVVPHQSGTGGCALSRDNDQETVERITRVFPHWFGARFREFAGREELLPLDQHLLVALVAPRPLLETVGLQDTWANYESSLRGLRAASRAWEVQGAPGLVGEGLLGAQDELPGPESGRLLQLRLDKPHVLDADYWTRILDFAERQLR